MRSKTVRFRQYTADSEKKRNYAFQRIREVKCSVLAENAEWNGAFSGITWYSRKSGYVLVFNTYLIKIFEILGLGLIFYWMMPKNCEKNHKISCICTFNRDYGNKLSDYFWVSATFPLNSCWLSAFRYVTIEPTRVLQCQPAVGRRETVGPGPSFYTMSKILSSQFWNPLNMFVFSILKTFGGSSSIYIYVCHSHSFRI